MILAVKGAKRVQDKLRWLQKQSRRHNNVGVIVGYTAAYAIFVHEHREMKLKGQLRGAKRGQKGFRGRFWDPQGRGQSKFLEQPFRELHNELIDDIFQITKSLGIAKGNGLDVGLLTAGLRLQKASQELVPVDTGNLKASAFTRLVQANRGRG